MKLEDVNMPIFLEAFRLAYTEVQEFSALSRPRIEVEKEIKRLTNINYHLMIEAILEIKS